MNERIEKLKLQAIKLVAQSYPCNIEDFTDGLDERIRAKVDAKFAELIMKECIRVPYDMWDKAELNADMAVKIEHRIKEHFGFEE